MASKVLKVKLWDGEDGKKWKCNVRDIEGEVLCGAFFRSCPLSFHLTSCQPSWCHPSKAFFFLTTLFHTTNA